MCFSLPSLPAALSFLTPSGQTQSPSAPYVHNLRVASLSEDMATPRHPTPSSVITMRITERPPRVRPYFFPTVDTGVSRPTHNSTGPSTSAKPRLHRSLKVWRESLIHPPSSLTSPLSAICHSRFDFLIYQDSLFANSGYLLELIPHNNSGQE